MSVGLRQAVLTSPLRPCPCCGSQAPVKIKRADEEEDFDHTNDNSYAIICDFTQDGCGCCGGYRLELDDAIGVWNRRAPTKGDTK